LNDDYFSRLKDRVTRLGQAGVYVCVMLLESWCVQVQCRARRDLHVFAAGNNCNGIDILASEADGILRAWCTLDNPAVVRIQEAYIRKVVETLNACDNVLYEISNEPGKWSHEWQEHLITFIRSVESSLPKRHPVGHTGGCGTAQQKLFASSADFIAPDANAADGGGRGYFSGAYTWGSAPFDRSDKVVMLDTDHLWGIGGDDAWAWKSFCRGYQLLYMDPCTNEPWNFFSHPDWPLASHKPLRHALGKIREYSERLNLKTSTPCNHLSTTTYCLATPGQEYLAYQPDHGAFSLDLPAGTYDAEWHWPAIPSSQPGMVIQHGGGWKTFQANANSVLLLKRKA
jgi:hypothetical protein